MLFFIIIVCDAGGIDEAETVKLASSSPLLRNGAALDYGFHGVKLLAFLGDNHPYCQ